MPLRAVPRLASACLLSLVAASAAACGGAGDDGGDDDVAPDAAPPREFGGERQVELQVPAGFDPAQRYPLVLILHGYSVSGLLQQAYLGLGELALDGHAFVLAPDGVEDSQGNKAWNSGGACCGDRAADDVAYLGGLIDDVSAAWPVDPARVYVIGHSNGHFMAYRMACERADVISAIVGLAGAMISTDGSGCTPSQPVSSLHIHGTADETIGYDGGTIEGTYPGAIASVELWADKAGCAATRTAGEPIDLVRDLAGAETQVEAHDACPAGLGVELWTIVAGSHIPNLVDGSGDRMFAWLQAHARE